MYKKIYYLIVCYFLCIPNIIHKVYGTKYILSILSQFKCCCCYFGRCYIACILPCSIYEENAHEPEEIQYDQHVEYRKIIDDAQTADTKDTTQDVVRDFSKKHAVFVYDNNDTTTNRESNVMKQNLLAIRKKFDLRIDPGSEAVHIKFENEDSLSPIPVSILPKIQPDLNDCSSNSYVSDNILLKNKLRINKDE